MASKPVSGLNHLVNESDLKIFSRMASRFLSGKPAFATSGPLLGSRPGVSSDFLDYGDYCPGDDLRRIDWRVSSRSQTLKVRRYCRELASDWFICLDGSSSMATVQGLKWRLAAQLAAAMAYILLDLGHRVALLVYSGEVDRYCGLGRGHSQFAKILNDLSCHRLKDIGADTRLSSCLRHVGKSGPVICIADFLSGVAAETDLTSLALGQRQMHALAVSSPGDLVLRGSGTVELYDVETGARLTLSSVENAQIQAELKFESHLKSLRSLCALNGIQFTKCSSEENWQQVLMRHFLQKNLNNARV